MCVVKKTNELVLVLNSDDFNKKAVSNVAKYVRAAFNTVKYYRRYSKFKMMSWAIFKIDMGRNISWAENDNIVSSTLDKAINYKTTRQ